MRAENADFYDEETSMPARKPIIPPGGFAGFAQQTPAVQTLLSGRASGTVTRRRRKTRRKKKTAARRRPAAKRTRRKTTRRAKKPAYMVKGSAAAKRHMAKLRKMRK